jgi:hypothetical protein
MMSKAKLDYGYGYNETNSIAIIWEIDDVRRVIEDYKMSINLSDKECLDVLRYMDRKHDAEFGICWDTIFYTIQYLFEEKLKKEVNDE